MKTLFVVGNKFHDFSSHDHVVTIGELQTLADARKLDRFEPGTRLMAGQGILASDIQQIFDSIATSDSGGHLDLSGLACRPVRASSVYTHKHKLHNSIISHPVRRNDGCFETELVVDERSELMGDHQTGQHIQGMILVEAARQTFLAVTEEFFIDQSDHRRHYFVINRMDVKFQSFVFPLDAILRYEIVESDTQNRDRMRFSVVVTVEQCGQSATRIDIDFTVFLADRIESKERQLAADALQKRIAMADADMLSHWQAANDEAIAA